MSDSQSSTDSSDLTFLQALYFRMSILQILYGVYLVLYFQTMHILLRPSERREQFRRFYMFFSTSILVLITIWIATQLMLGDLMWVINYNYPGGPLAYLVDHTPAWHQVVGVGALTVLQTLTDALMIYRCYVVWDSYWVILVPCALWLATCVTGILLIWNATFLSSKSRLEFPFQLAMSYFSFVSALNIISTALICCCTMRYDFMVKKRLAKLPTALYCGITAVVVESMLPYTLTGIVFLIMYAIGSPWWQLFLSMNTVFNCISPQVLILRVITGKTRERDMGFSPVSFRLEAASASLGRIGAADTGPHLVEIPAVSARGSCSTKAPAGMSTSSSLQQQSNSSGTRTDHKKFIEGSDERV